MSTIVSQQGSTDAGDFCFQLSSWRMICFAQVSQVQSGCIRFHIMLVSAHVFLVKGDGECLEFCKLKVLSNLPFEAFIEHGDKNIRIVETGLQD